MKALVKAKETKMAVPFMFLQDSLNVMLGGKMYNVQKSDPKFEEVKQAIRDGEDERYIVELLDKKETLIRGGKGRLVVEDGDVFFDGRVCVGPIVDRILYMIDEDIDVSHIEKFLVNLEQNPSSRSVSELYSFLEQCNLPITEDGFFLAYKKVGPEWLDLHSGTIVNKPGMTISMPRNTVDDNFNNGCSAGLHVASREYYVNSGYGAGSQNKLIVVKVNPKDVVSVPLDCNFTKMRVCEYEVIEEVEDTDTLKANFIEKKEYDDSWVEDNSQDYNDYDEYVGSDYDEEQEHEDFFEEEDSPEEIEDKKDPAYNEEVAKTVMEYLQEKAPVASIDEDDLISEHFGVLSKFNIIRHLAKAYDVPYATLRDKKYNYVCDIITNISEEL
jgi:hypothetical protein